MLVFKTAVLQDVAFTRLLELTAKERDRLLLTIHVLPSFRVIVDVCIHTLRTVRVI